MTSSEEALEQLIAGMERTRAFIWKLVESWPDYGAAMAAYAESLGKSVEELTEGERKQAALEAALEHYGDD